MSSLGRAEFESFWDRLDAEALAAKQSQHATVRLVSFYRALDEGDREMVDEAVADWVVADDDRRRFDALALIKEFENPASGKAMRVWYNPTTGEREYRPE